MEESEVVNVQPTDDKNQAQDEHLTGEFQRYIHPIHLFDMDRWECVYVNSFELRQPPAHLEQEFLGVILADECKLGVEFFVRLELDFETVYSISLTLPVPLNYRSIVLKQRTDKV